MKVCWLVALPGEYNDEDDCGCVCVFLPFVQVRGVLSMYMRTLTLDRVIIIYQQQILSPRRRETISTLSFMHDIPIRGFTFFPSLRHTQYNMGMFVSESYNIFTILTILIIITTTVAKESERAKVSRAGGEMAHGAFTSKKYEYNTSSKKSMVR